MQRSILSFFSKVPGKNKDSLENKVIGVEPSCSSQNAGSLPKPPVNVNVGLRYVFVKARCYFMRNFGLRDVFSWSE